MCRDDCRIPLTSTSVVENVHRVHIATTNYMEQTH